MSELARVLDQTVALLQKYVVFAVVEQAYAVALWVGNTWTYDQFDVTPYLTIQSPEKRSGKTRLQEVLSLVVRHPLRSAGASLAALFRSIQERHPTLLLDEVDTVFNKRRDPGSEDIRGLLNNGYRAGIPYLRVVGEGKMMHVEQFDVFSPKCVASIGRLPDTVQDRSIVISLRRRAAFESVTRFRFRVAELEAVPIKEWWEAISAELTLPDQADVPDQLDDRAQDSWEPLLALADAAGGEWPDRARRAALVLSGAADPEDDTLSVQLLADIRTIFGEQDVDRIGTKSLLEALRANEESPWDEYGRDGLKSHALSRLLKPYAIGPRLMKINGTASRGYDRAWFEDPFARYLPSPATRPPERYSVTSEHESERAGNGVTIQAPVTGDGTNGTSTLWNGELRHSCSACHRLTDADELMIRGGQFVHREACAVPA